MTKNLYSAYLCIYPRLLQNLSGCGLCVLYILENAVIGIRPLCPIIICGQFKNGKYKKQCVLQTVTIDFLSAF